MFEKLKGKKGTEEYERWFLKYSPKSRNKTDLRNIDRGNPTFRRKNRKTNKRRTKREKRKKFGFLSKYLR